MNTIENVYILVEQQTCLHCNNGVSNILIIVIISAVKIINRD